MFNHIRKIEDMILPYLKTDDYYEAFETFAVACKSYIADTDFDKYYDDEYEEILSKREDNYENEPVYIIKDGEYHNLWETKDTSYKSDIMKDLNIEVGSDEEAELDSILDTDYDLAWDELDDEEQAHREQAHPGLLRVLRMRCR